MAMTINKPHHRHHLSSPLVMYPPPPSHFILSHPLSISHSSVPLSLSLSTLLHRVNTVVNFEKNFPKAPRVRQKMEKLSRNQV